MKGENIPSLVVTNAFANELINVLGMALDVLPRGTKNTAYRIMFRIGLEDEDTALRIRMLYILRENHKIALDTPQG